MGKRKGLPSCDCGGGVGGGIGALGREADVSDALAIEGLGEVPDGDVVVQRTGIVVRVNDDRANSSSGTTRSPSLDEYQQLSLL